MIDAQRQSGSSDVAGLARVVGHEMGEIAALLDGYMGLMVDSAATSGVGGMRGAVDRLRELCDDLLSFARVASTPPGRTVIDPTVPLAAARRRLGEPSGAPNLEIDGDALPAVLADGRQLEQLFVQVLRSAASIRSLGRCRHLVVAGSRQGPEVRLDITGDGGRAGRRHGSAPARPVMVELGRQIAAHNGGRLWVDANGTGAPRISLTLPAAEP